MKLQRVVDLMEQEKVDEAKLKEEWGSESEDADSDVEAEEEEEVNEEVMEWQKDLARAEGELDDDKKTKGMKKAIAKTTLPLIIEEEESHKDNKNQFEFQTEEPFDPLSFLADALQAIKDKKH